MSEREGILQAIAEEPADETNWLVLADWLEENNEADRAELTRLQRSLQSRRQGAARRQAEERVRDLLLSGTRPCVPVRSTAVGIDLTLIPAGSFRMGSPVREQRRMNDETLHRVDLTAAFWMGVFPVTQGQFEAVQGGNPSRFHAGQPEMAGTDAARCPVESVTWEEATRFCRALNRRERVLPTGWEYRLPTEAEWEYACRAWVSPRWPFYFGTALTTSQANFDGRHPYPHNYDADNPHVGHTVVAGRYPPNAFGLYDMHGNVDEWCSDWYDHDYYLLGPVVDPAGPRDGHLKVYRGGSWSGQGEDCRAAVRIGRPTDDADARIGFRVVLARSLS